MKVSIITAFYKGNQYIEQLLGSIEVNFESCKKNGIEIESVIVNDSPDYQIDIDSNRYSFDVKVLRNKINSGIHKTRIHGIYEASGDYLIILDQDDVITPEAIVSQCSEIGDADVCVGNGYQIDGEKWNLIFRNKQYLSLVKELQTFIKLGTPIISPGQCLIRKDSIPRTWLEHPMMKNGADDEILWILMHIQGKRFNTNFKDVYHHIATGNNASDNFLKMAQSSLEGMDLLKCTNISTKNLNTFKRRRMMKRERFNSSSLKKIWINLKYIDLSIFVIRVKYLQCQREDRRKDYFL